MKCFFCKCLLCKWTQSQTFLFARLGWDSLHGPFKHSYHFEITKAFHCHVPSISSHGFAWTWTLECLGEKHPVWQTEKWWTDDEKWRFFERNQLSFICRRPWPFQVFLDRSTIQRTSHETGIWWAPRFLKEIKDGLLRVLRTCGSCFLERHYLRSSADTLLQEEFILSAECQEATHWMLKGVLSPFLLLRNSRLNPLHLAAGSAVVKTVGSFF